MHQYLLALVGATLLVGCSSALKKRCESTNWFDYGKSVALSGRRLDSDDLARNCQKEDVPVDHAALDMGFKAGMSNYCQPETVYANGRQGVDFNPGLCDGSNVGVLKNWHVKGLREYCLPDNGYRVGAQGKELRKVCPPDLAPAFERKHSQGRVVYLNEMAKQKEQEVQLLNQQQRDYSTDLFRKEALLAALPFVAEPESTNGKPPEQLTNRQRGILRQRESLAREISSLQRKIEELRNQQRTTQQQISEYRSEATALAQAPAGAQN